jgi:hypothetical protein
VTCLLPCSMSVKRRGAQATRSRSAVRPPGVYQFNCTFAVWHPETGGAKGSEPERAGGPPVPLVRKDVRGH